MLELLNEENLQNLPETKKIALRLVGVSDL